MIQFKKKPFRLSYLLLLIFLSTGITRGGETSIWPVDTKPAHTSSFGEFRPGHFHSGIDLKLYGRVGAPCRAVEDGWVSRIKVTPTGYGRALYLTLIDGRTAVYAHLNSFAPVIEELVQREQHKQQSYSIELFFTPDSAVRFKRGDLVAYAGRSGVKHPHVHFEIRDSAEKPMNPWFQGFNVADDISPVPRALAIEPLDGNSTVEEDYQPRIWSDLVRRNNGVWGPRDPIGVSGRIGISVKAWDKANTAENLLAVYQLEMYVNGIMRWETRFDKFNFDEADLIEVERNYRLYRRGKGVYHRLYRSPGNRLDMCYGDGIIDTDNSDRFPLEVIIQLMDAKGNQSRIALILVNDDDPDNDRLVTGEPLISCSSWGSPAHDRISIDIFDKYLRFSGPPGLGGINVNSALNINLVTRLTGGREVAAWTPSGEIIDPLKITAIDHSGRPIEDCSISLYQVLPFESCIIESDDGKIRAEIPMGAVYDTTWMRIIHEPSYIVPGDIESVYRIEPRDQPLNGKVFIKIACDENTVARSGWGVYYLDARSGWTFLDNTQEDGFLAASALSWETFGLVKDENMPYLDVQKPVDNETLRSADMSLYAVVRDTTSGIIAEDIIVTIDGKKVPAEYDPPRKRILYRPWRNLSPGSHELTVFIKDRVGNSTVRSLSFNIIP